MEDSEAVGTKPLAFRLYFEGCRNFRQPSLFLFQDLKRPGSAGHKPLVR